MINYEDFKQKVDQAILDKTGFLFKGFLSKNDTPTWSDLLNCLHQESQESDAKDLSSKEKAYGNVLLSDNLYLSSHLDNTKASIHFPKIEEMLNSIREKTNINIMLVGPKICIGPHIVDFHVDSWHAFALQCEGKAKWVLSNSKDSESASYLEEFYPEPGDLLFFPQGLWHRIETQDSVRGGLQFNAQIIS
jgi:hypothetical protein